jgi:hypothetical protein
MFLNDKEPEKYTILISLAIFGITYQWLRRENASEKNDTTIGCQLYNPADLRLQPG